MDHENNKPLLKIGTIKAENAVLLAPMEGVTDLSFRILCRRMGADIVCTEFIASEALIRDSKKSFDKLKTEDEERPVSIQIFGSNSEAMTGSARIVEEAGANILDINFGCWVKKVVNNNAGAALLKDPVRLAKLTNDVVKTVKIPVTAKTRLGWDKNNFVILDVAKMIEDAGASAIAVHCRTRDMGMKGEPDWNWIPKIKDTVKIPVILNGDVKSHRDAKRAFVETGCDAVMIGRAAIGNPFIFRQVKQYLETGMEPVETTVDERIETMLEHLRIMIKYKSLPRGLNEFRKHYSGYLKGMYMSSAVRQKVVIMDTYAEIEDTLNQYLAMLKQEGRLLPVESIENDDVNGCM